MMKFLSKGVFVAVLTVAALIASAFGKAELAAFLQSPEMADALQTVIVSGGVIVAGVLEGVKKKEVVIVEVPAAPVDRAAATASLLNGQA
jgi:hypothetical protein